jgi:hypothetical protein
VGGALTALSVAAGAVLVALVAWDIFLTILHPSARGPLSYRTNRATWRAVRAAAGITSVRRLLAYAGPVALAVNVTAWIAGLWLGFALVYLPYVDQLSYDQSVSYGAPGLGEALYASGVSLSTLGLGDVLLPTDVLRLVATVESAAGLGAFTSAVAYVLAVYPLVTTLRANTLRLYDMEALDPRGAAAAAVLGGPSALGRVVADLVESHEYFRRFPILYYFESGHEREESIDTLLRGTATVCLVTCWGLRHDRLEHAAHYGPALERSLHRMLDDLERDFVGGRRTAVESEELEEQDAAAKLRALRSEVAEATPEIAVDPDEDGEVPEGFRRLFSRAQGVLDAIAHEHGLDHEPLLGERVDQAARRVKAPA